MIPGRQFVQVRFCCAALFARAGARWPRALAAQVRTSGAAGEAVSVLLSRRRSVVTGATPRRPEVCITCALRRRRGCSCSAGRQLAHDAPVHCWRRRRFAALCAVGRRMPVRRRRRRRSPSVRATRSRAAVASLLRSCPMRGATTCQFASSSADRHGLDGPTRDARRGALPRVSPACHAATRGTRRTDRLPVALRRVSASRRQFWRQRVGSARRAGLRRARGDRRRHRRRRDESTASRCGRIPRRRRAGDSWPSTVRPGAATAARFLPRRARAVVRALPRARQCRLASGGGVNLPSRRRSGAASAD